MSKTKNPLVAVRQLFGRTESWCSDLGDAKWMLITAMRGPDDDHNLLKIRTAWRIRHAVFGPRFFGDGRILGHPLPDRPLEGEDGGSFRYRIIKEILEQYPGASKHYLGHYAAACWIFWKYCREPKKRAHKKKT